MSRALDDLSPACRPIVVEFLARVVEANIPIIIVDTLRTPAEQAANIARGVSWTKHSRHLTGDAIDIAPYEQFLLHGPDKLRWDGTDPIWQVLGKLGERCGLIWGGRWVKTPDFGHFELPREGPPVVNV